MTDVDLGMVRASDLTCPERSWAGIQTQAVWLPSFALTPFMWTCHPSADKERAGSWHHMPRVLVEIILLVDILDVNLQPRFQSKLLAAMYIVCHIQDYCFLWFCNSSYILLFHLWPWKFKPLVRTWSKGKMASVNKEKLPYTLKLLPLSPTNCLHIWWSLHAAVSFDVLCAYTAVSLGMDLFIFKNNSWGME